MKPGSFLFIGTLERANFSKVLVDEESSDQS